MEPSAGLQEEGIRQPPKGVLSSIKFMGPGLILSAAIVGSGELIATTSMGAETGFALMWVILLGCLVKVAVQLEYGRFCIAHGIPTFQAWNFVGRGKIRGLHWTVWVGMIYMIANMFGQAGILGGAAQVAVYAVPAVSLGVWVFLIALFIAVSLFNGRYGFIELTATLLNGFFVLAVFYCVFALQSTEYAFSFGDLMSGLSFHLPAGAISLAVAAFGITGVAAGEIAMYPYWCLEKGYATWTGPRDDTEEWERRAKGWMRVMTLDAFIAMVIYTSATCAFYILGATVLHAQEALADGNEFILQLSSLFTGVLGEGARNIFMLCAFAVLFSTIFANSAAFSRLWTDFFCLCRWIDWENRKERLFSIALMCWLYPMQCGMLYMVLQKPLLLVVFMGISNALFLAVVAYQAVIFRYRYTEARLKPSFYYDIALWLSLAAIAFMAARTLVSLFG